MRKRFYCRFLPLLVTTFIFTSCSLFSSNITEIDSITQAQEELQRAGNKTLVVFDMDETLIIRADSMVHVLYKDIKNFDPTDADFAKQLREDLEKFTASKKDPESLNKKLALAVSLQARFIPVEAKAVEIIKNLQARKVRVVALTAASAKKSVQKDRLSHLHQIGLDFSDSFALKEAGFDKFPKKFKFRPAFCYGILCTSEVPKGEVLAAFLDKIGWKPDKVIFFDDYHHHCESVDGEMSKRGIPARCYWYRAVFKNKTKLNQKVVKYQFDYWMKYQDFVPENEALRVL